MTGVGSAKDNVPERLRGDKGRRIPQDSKMTTSKRELHVFFETPMSLRHIQTSAPRKQNASPLSESCITSLSTQTNILDWTVSTKHRAQTQGQQVGLGDQQLGARHHTQQARPRS